MEVEGAVPRGGDEELVLRAVDDAPDGLVVLGHDSLGAGFEVESDLWHVNLAYDSPFLLTVSIFFFFFLFSFLWHGATWGKTTMLALPLLYYSLVHPRREGFIVVVAEAHVQYGRAVLKGPD